MTGKDRDEEAVRKTVDALVAKYAWKFPGRAETEELVQVAALAEATARRTFKPGGKARLATYVHRAVNVALFEAVCRGPAPVYVCRHLVRKLLGAYSVELEGDVREDPLEELGGLEGLLDRARAYRRLREVVEATGGREALDILLGGATVKGTAAELGVSVEVVRERKRAALEAVRADAPLRAFAAEL